MYRNASIRRLSTDQKLKKMGSRRRVLENGIGEVLKGCVKPSQALAKALRANLYSNISALATEILLAV